MSSLNKYTRAGRPTRALAVLAICASLLLAAAGTSLFGAPDTTGASTRVVHDPENPNWMGNTIDSPATTGSHIVRDPENPYWIGNTIGSTSIGGSSTPGLK